jgi:hypothetical protein
MPIIDACDMLMFAPLCRSIAQAGDIPDYRAAIHSQERCRSRWSPSTRWLRPIPEPAIMPLRRAITECGRYSYEDAGRPNR